METRVGAQTPYEVYCYSCKVTFPVGTRQCIHCGRPIGGGPLSRASAPPIRPRAGELPPDDIDLEMPGAKVRNHIGGLSVWVLLAVAAAVSRLCAGQ